MVLPDAEEVKVLVSSLENDISPWVDRAECHPRNGHDTAMWFPENPRISPRHPLVQAAKAVCGECVVRRECLEHALLFEPHGLWGGLTERERDAFRRSVGLDSMLRQRGGSDE